VTKNVHRESTEATIRSDEHRAELTGDDKSSDSFKHNDASTTSPIALTLITLIPAASSTASWIADRTSSFRGSPSSGSLFVGVAGAVQPYALPFDSLAPG
jgi:hypothetical protein